MSESKDQVVSRRDFLKTSAVATATAALMASGNYAFAAASDKLKVGLIGCGGRGTGALENLMSSVQNIEVWALGDAFKDRLDGAYNYGKGKYGENFKVTPERAFVGFDAYKKVLASGVDTVILATPPGFRPIHFAAAIDAGKHVFMEKPVAVDPNGIRMVIKAAELAAQKKLAVVAGTQRRHQAPYVANMKRIQDGAIGQIVSAQCYWNQGGLWKHDRGNDESDMEYQIRNWLYYTWLSGDHIVEQHVHNIDVINWALGGHPVKARSMGGRQVRTGNDFGHIFDHFATEFEYANGVRVLSMCRQIDGCWSDVSERVVGTKGVSNCGGWIGGGAPEWRFEGQSRNPYEQEHMDMIASIRAGAPLNEGKRIAESTLTAIMARMSAYTGKEVSWDFAMNESKLDIVPKSFEFGKLDTPAVAVPGQTELI